jgi:pectin methylesterase-like acyl-CoA thioesterase
MISINMQKAKAIGHDIRRAARAEEFKPLDIKATIPAEAAAAEVARQAVREKYAAIQAAIDAAVTVDEIKAALP